MSRAAARVRFFEVLFLWPQHVVPEAETIYRAVVECLGFVSLYLIQGLCHLSSCGFGTCSVREVNHYGSYKKIIASVSADEGDASAPL
jgi:hypothetical protein